MSTGFAPTLKLLNTSTMVEMPVLGLGTWKLTDQRAISELIPKAILELGYRHIDTAAVYENETLIGNVWSEVFSKVPRKEIFVTSKLWCTQHDQVREACESSLKRLKLDYLDCYLIHWPFAFQAKPGEPLNSIRDSKNHPLLNKSVTLEDTWREMEKLVKDGLVRSIGVSNFNIARLKRILSIAAIKPAINQVRNVF